MEKKLELTFYGGTGSVTGANFILREPDGLTLMFDCGLTQGEVVCDNCNLDDFPYDVAAVDYLFVSHAHIDHIGRIPKLVHDGFRGKIISTPPTKDIAELLLIDSIGVLEKEAKRGGTPPLFGREDVERALSVWETAGYHEELAIGEFKIIFKDAGHILGSAMTEVSYGAKKIVFTGDLGNSPEPILRDTEAVGHPNYLVMESVYGDRAHEHRDERRRLLEDVISQTYNRKGVLMIPAFSVERTQLLLHELNAMIEEGLIPPVPVYLDSPLAIKVTAIYGKHKSYLADEALQSLTGGKDLFDFPWLHRVMQSEESKRIIEKPAPKIIIAGSGMSNGGRIVHHEKAYLPDPNNTLLLVGYQAAGTPGRVLQDGASEVELMGESVPVLARVLTVSGYSAHRDKDGLFDFVAGGVDTLEQVYAVMGEPKAALFLVQRVRDNLGINASAPEAGQTIVLDF